MDVHGCCRHFHPEFEEQLAGPDEIRPLSERSTQQGNVARPSLGAHVVRDRKLPNARPTQNARHPKRAAELPCRLIHGNVPQPVAELRSRAEATPGSNLLSFVVDLQIVDDGVGVETQHIGDKSGIAPHQQRMAGTARRAIQGFECVVDDRDGAIGKPGRPSSAQQRPGV